MASTSPDEEEELRLRLKVLLISPGHRCGIRGWQRCLHLGGRWGAVVKSGFGGGRRQEGIPGGSMSTHTSRLTSRSQKMRTHLHISDNARRVASGVVERRDGLEVLDDGAAQERLRVLQHARCSSN